MIPAKPMIPASQKSARLFVCMPCLSVLLLVFLYSYLAVCIPASVLLLGCLYACVSVCISACQSAFLLFSMYFCWSVYIPVFLSTYLLCCLYSVVCKRNRHYHSFKNSIKFIISKATIVVTVLIKKQKEMGQQNNGFCAHLWCKISKATHFSIHILRRKKLK